MANLQETPTWEAGIYQLETSDPVMGGENGIDNRAPRQLANRTLWLKNELARQIEAVNSGKLGKTENAVSATKLATARNISTTGDATWSVLFDGSTNASGALTLANSGVTAGSYNAVTVDSKGRVTRGLTQVHGLITATTATGTANQATTNTNTYLNIVASGVGSTASVGSSTQVTGTNGISISSDTTGQLIISRDSNSPTATKLQTPCTINGVAFDGTANITIADATKAPAVHRHNWSEIDGKPSTFTPSSHTHAWSQITGVPSASTTTQGIVQLNDTLVSTATDQALTANQGKVLNDKITATDANADNKVDKSGDAMTGLLTLNNQRWPSVKLASNNGNQALLLESGGTDGTHCLIIRPHTDGVVSGNTPNIARFNLPTVTGTKTLATEDGNIASATRLQTARTIALTGAVTGSVSFNGSANVSIATTLNLADFANSKTENGYQKLPNGLIIQWGKTPLVRDEQNVDITFPIAFTSAVMSIQLTEDNNTTVSAHATHCIARSATLTGFNFWINSTMVTGTKCYWLAIGY